MDNGRATGINIRNQIYMDNGYVNGMNLKI